MTTTLAARPARAQPDGVAGIAPARLRLLGYAALAALAYVPMLLTAPGRVVADTKSYLYLDPGRLLERAPSMWDPNIGLGTVTHQNIGYLLPMGPYYWLMHFLGVPAWVSQRIWFGSILLFAALGMLYLFRTLHVRGPGVVVGTLVFMLSPYTITFASRLSVILLPWAGLPLMLALVIRALRDDGWKYPALFAIVVQIVGSVNATALVFAGIVPALWVLYAWLVTREVDWRRVVSTVAKITALTILASLWWIVGLAIQSSYGLDVLKFTETLETVSQASLPVEVMRGLGYWFFYGRDTIGPWIEPSVRYTQDIWLLAVSYGIPVLALLGAALVRWKHRAFFVFVTVIGVAVSVGANPYDDPSVLGRLFKGFAASSNFGLALRSTGRAVPLVTLGLAVLLGLGVNALASALAERRVPVLGLVVAGGVVALALVNVPARLDGSYYGENLQRDENIPSYWSKAIAALDKGPHDTRVLEIPGADFASYRWGQTVDPITPGLMDRPYVARELVPWGSPASADLLNALDRRLQEGVLEPSAIAPVARLMSVGDVVYRADLETDRFDLVRAVPAWLLLTKPSVPTGLGTPVAYGTSLGPPLHASQTDEIALALPPNAADPPPVSVFPVKNTPSIVRAEDASAPLVVSGDGEGLVDLASLGALADGTPVLYSGTYAGDTPALRREVAQPGSVLVVTDSNRKRARRWGLVRDVQGATERADETALTTDEGDSRLNVFPNAGVDAYTVVQSPNAQVSTTRYGNRISLWNEMRGSRALDGDVNTAWLVGDHAQVNGEKIRIDLDRPVTTGHVNLVQPLVGPRARYLTKVQLTFDGGDPITVDLDAASRTAAGQTVTFPKHTFHRLEISIVDTNAGDNIDYPLSSNVGFAEIRVRDDAPGATDVHADEIVRMPTDLVSAAGSLAADRPLVFEMSRSRTVVIPPRYSQDEVALVRKLRVPGARSFGAAGTIRLATAAPDNVLDTALGLPDAAAGGITVLASQHLPGDVMARGSSAFDGDPTTAWNTAFGQPQGQWVEVHTAQPVTFDHLDLQVVADGRHSVPTQLQIDAGGESRMVDLPAIADQSAKNAVQNVPVSFAPLTGDDVRVTVSGVRPVTTTEFHEGQPIVMPVALAEVGIPGVQRAALPSRLPDTCRTDLLTADGAPVGIRLDGDAAAAAAGGAVDFAVCDAALALAAGDHVVRTAPGVRTGIDVDRLVLGSQAGGAAMTLGRGGAFGTQIAATRTAAAGATPTVKVVKNGRTKMEVRVSGAQPGRPFWLVLGESNSAGWRATVDGDQGSPTLVDGYANGWLVTPATGTFSVTLEWTPQRTVWVALAISAAALLLCVALVIVWRKRRTSIDNPDLDGAVEFANPLGAADGAVSARAVVVSAVVAGLTGAVLARWWVGLIAAVLTAAALLRPRLRALLALGAPAAFALAALYVIVQQYRHRYASDFFWLTHFDRVQEIAWLAVILLACDALVEVVRARATPAHELPLAGDVDRE